MSNPFEAARCIDDVADQRADDQEGGLAVKMTPKQFVGLLDYRDMDSSLSTDDTMALAHFARLALEYVAATTDSERAIVRYKMRDAGFVG